MENKQAIIDNLEALLTAVKAQPENLFDLDNWKEDTACGTAFCVAGLAASMPKFQALGMAWTWDAYPQYNGVNMWHSGGDELFGAKSWGELFKCSGDGELDRYLGLPFTYDEYDDLQMECTDKELAIARLEHRIATYKASLESA